MIKVSIIVPVYNVEAYLRKCLESLVNQTMQEIEIILVNDASPDHSDEVMREYESKYPGLVKCIFLTENVRLGGARNRGLAIASGKYISFVDSDDWIDADLMEKLYDKAEKMGSDIVYADFMMVAEEKYETRPNMYPQLCGKQDDRKRKMNLLLTGTSACACIIRKSLLLDNGLSFTEGIVYEDMAVCPLYAYYADRLDYVSGTYYYYFQREDSITHDVDAACQKEEAEALLLLLGECKRRGIAERYPVEVEAMFTKYFYAWGMYGIYHGKFSEPPLEYMEYLAGEMDRRFPAYRENPYFYGNIEPELIGYMFENDQKWLGCDAKENVSYIDYYRQKRIRDKLDRLFETLEGKKTALWGAGKKGREFLEAVSGRYPVACVIDKKKSLVGSHVETGEEIVSPEEGLGQVEAVLVINKNYYEGIRRTVREQSAGILIINMDIYLLSEFSAQECIE